MSAFTVDGWIVFDAFRAQHPEIWPCPYRFAESAGDDEVKVREHSITFEVPDNFDPRPGMVEQLEKKKREIQADAQVKVSAIEREISQLLAIECSGVGA